jgi:integrase
VRGHLQQRGRDTWRLKVYVGRSADGRKRYIERTVHGTRREAERALARLVVEVDQARHVVAAPMTFGELLDRWIAVKGQSVEASTLKSYE